MGVVVITLAILAVIYTTTTNEALAQSSGIQTVNQTDCLSLSKQINKDNTDKSISPSTMLDILNNYIHHYQ